MERLDDKVVLYTSFEDFGKMQSKLEEMKIETENAEIQRVPKITNALPLDQAQTILKMIDKFEEDDDVNTVYHDMELTDELVAELEKE
jgi:transcriptional/translational regulatory protein YebC/TACO1